LLKKVVVVAKGSVSNPGQIGNDEYREYHFVSEENEFAIYNNEVGQLIVNELIPRYNGEGTKPETKAMFNTGQWVSWMKVE